VAGQYLAVLNLRWATNALRVISSFCWNGLSIFSGRFRLDMVLNPVLLPPGIVRVFLLCPKEFVQRVLIRIALDFALCFSVESWLLVEQRDALHDHHLSKMTSELPP